jgi:NAD-dependent DNA ligase
MKSLTELVKLIQDKDNYKKNAQNMSVDELVKLMKKLSNVYYNTGETLVSDAVYDLLKDLLEQKDPDNPYLYEVGAPIKGTKEKVILPFEMGSLSKIKSDEKELEKWSKKYKGTYVLSDKLDGASAQLYKNNNGEIFLYSRGNGKEGQNISHLIPYVISKNTLDLLLPNSSVRGELIISKKNFKKISSYMKNARNAVSGLANSKTVDKKIASITNFVAYSILNPRYTQLEQMKLLDRWKFDVVNYKLVKSISIEKLSKYLTERKNISDYEMDGIVCVDNSKVYPHKGGYLDHTFAFKMISDEQVSITKVVQVHWKISMDGYIKPRIQIEPVELGGTTVTYATAFNAKFIVDNKIGKGAVIKIVRSGDVIPYILDVVSPSKSGPDMPDYEYVWNETEVDIKVKKIEGESKKLVTIKLITHFFREIGVKYLSEGIIIKLVDNGYDSIFKILKANRDSVAKIEGLGEKSVNKIYDEIDRAFEEMELSTFMGASHKFGRGMGTRKLQEIILVYPDILKWNNNKKEIIDKVLQVSGFSDKLANLFADNFDHFKDFYNKVSEIKDLSRFEKIKKTKSKEKLFKDQHIAFTGFRDKELENFIIDNGGKVTTSVSKNTAILVCKDDADTSTVKFQKAESLGIKILTKTKFEKKYNLKK